jgi:uncharacterized membrane protein YdcZ (DUF606 family)
LPLSLFGLGELLRVPQVRRNRLLAMIVGAVIALVALSVPAYKDSRYVLAVVPFMYAFAGLCLAAFVRSPDQLRPATVSVVRASMLIACVAFGGVMIGHFAGAPISRAYLFAHAAGTVLAIVLGELWMRTKFVTRELGILAVVGLVGFAVAYPRVVTPPPYAAIASVLREHLAGSPPAYPSFMANDSDVLQGYLGYAGLTFEDLGERPERAEQDASLKAFVVAPDEDNDQARALLEWLRANTHEVSASLVAATGEDSGYRLFVR